MVLAILTLWKPDFFSPILNGGAIKKNVMKKWLKILVFKRSGFKIPIRLSSLVLVFIHSFVRTWLRGVLFRWGHRLHHPHHGSRQIPEKNQNLSDPNVNRGAKLENKVKTKHSGLFGRWTVLIFEWLRLFKYFSFTGFYLNGLVLVLCWKSGSLF